MPTIYNNFWFLKYGTFLHFHHFHPDNSIVLDRSISGIIYLFTFMCSGFYQRDPFCFFVFVLTKCFCVWWFLIVCFGYYKLIILIGVDNFVSFGRYIIYLKKIIKASWSKVILNQVSKMKTSRYEYTGNTFDPNFLINGKHTDYESDDSWLCLELSIKYWVTCCWMLCVVIPVNT